MLVGKPPFSSQNFKILRNMIINDKPNYYNLNSKTKNLLSKLLEKDPTIRRQLCQNLRNDPFFEGLNWFKLEYQMEKAPFVPPPSKLIESQK